MHCVRRRSLAPERRTRKALRLITPRRITPAAIDPQYRPGSSMLRAGGPPTEQRRRKSCTAAHQIRRRLACSCLVRRRDVGTSKSQIYTRGDTTRKTFFNKRNGAPSATFPHCNVTGVGPLLTKMLPLAILGLAGLITLAWDAMLGVALYKLLT